MKNAKNITVIPATLNKHTGLPTQKTYRRKVAGYARVSTDSEEQQTSYEAQVDYYSHYIRSKPEWQFVEVYTDEGISATNTKKRDGFNRMIQDAIIVSSVYGAGDRTRFAFSFPVGKKIKVSASSSRS